MSIGDSRDLLQLLKGEHLTVLTDTLRPGALAAFTPSRMRSGSKGAWCSCGCSWTLSAAIRGGSLDSENASDLRRCTSLDTTGPPWPYLLIEGFLVQVQMGEPRSERERACDSRLGRL
jgi:hypothetical protein